MREVNVSQITEAVKELCIEANYYLSEDVKKKEVWLQALYIYQN